MRSNVQDFINAAKARLLVNVKKPVFSSLLMDEKQKLSILTTQYHIDLSKNELLLIKESVKNLSNAVDLIRSAMASLSHFEQFDVSHLRLGGSYALGTINMLEEALESQRGVSAKVCDFATRGEAR